MTDSFDGLKTLDRALLMMKMAEELPAIREQMGISIGALAPKVGIDEQRLEQMENRTVKAEWSEFMSILFVLWNNDIGRGIIESKGLFPEALKRAMATNRNEHIPETMGGIYGLDTNRSF